MSESPYTALHAAVLDLFHDTVSRHPPAHAPGAEPEGGPPYRLGEYLVYQGYLSPRELRLALLESRAPGRAKPVPLGLILATHYRIPARVLAITLLLQTIDRLIHTPGLPPRFLGEQLLYSSALSPQQLAAVLEEQVANYALGRWSRIGDLIAAQGWLDAEALEAIVREVNGATPKASGEASKESDADSAADLAAILAVLSGATPPGAARARRPAA